MLRFRFAWHFLPLLLAASWPLGARAQLVVSDTLTGPTSSYNWMSINGACLTAGTYSATSSSSIPGCAGLPYYSGKTLVGGVSGRLPDPSGQGALRLSNGDTAGGTNGNNQTGAVVSNFTFPSGQGVQLTFTSVTYGGNGYNGTGADGMVFFLMDGARSPNIGAYGGSLGYSCSNNKDQADGVLGGYIGLGVDEFGNFSNPDDTTASGPGFRPGSIVLRGAGNITWAWLNANYPSWYPSTLSAASRSAAVRDTCRTGYLWNYNVFWPYSPYQTTTPVRSYPLISAQVLPSTQPIANQQAVAFPTRGNAIPITYSLKITQAGLLSLSYSYNGGAATPVLTDQSITASNGALPSTFRFGFSSGTGGGSNVHEITCFKAEQVATSSSSGGVNAQQAARVQAGTQVYLAYYRPTNSWGQLTANSLVYDTTSDSVTLASTANWDAHCVLTGGTCQATGGASVTAQGSASRTLLTWSGSQGIPFQWTNLTTAQRTALTAGDSTSNSDRMNYLRGDRSKEVTSSGTGTFRARSGVLGDIQNSSPAWVGPPTTNYPDTWRDRLTGAQGVETGYSTFQSTWATRPHVVYVGSNDGWLHGFRAGANDSSGNFSTATTPNDGREVIGYMPSQVVNTIHSTTSSLSFASPSYITNAFVDATPATGEIFYKGAWRTWLVGGLGAGGNATGLINNRTATGTGTIFALDITNPASFSEANASSLVIGELTSANLSCVGITNCGAHLGNTYGTPLIRRLHNGEWALIFGNGRNSANGVAGIFVVTFNATSGAATVRFLSTGYGPSRDPLGANGKNGIAFVSSADLDGDRITDYIYAGDAFGFVWRFDLTSSDPANWGVRTAPVFSTGGLPITTRVLVSSALSSTGAPRVVLNFGTGQAFPQTATAAASYASGTQYLFGVWDTDMTTWNGLGGASAQYATLSSAASPYTVAVSELLTQTITSISGTNGEVNGYRAVSQSNVCWRGSTTCTGGTTANNQMGWRMALPGTSEQIVFNPVLFNSLLVVNTLIPANNQPLSCTSTASGGFTMAIRADTGGAPTTSFFSSLTTSSVAIPTGTTIGGVGLNGTGSPTFVTTRGKTVLVQQNNRGTGTAVEVNPTPTGRGKRVNWIRLR